MRKYLFILLFITGFCHAQTSTLNTNVTSLVSTNGKTVWSNLQQPSVRADILIDWSGQAEGTVVSSATMSSCLFQSGGGWAGPFLFQGGTSNTNTVQVTNVLYHTSALGVSLPAIFNVGGVLHDERTLSNGVYQTTTTNEAGILFFTNSNPVTSISGVWAAKYTMQGPGAADWDSIEYLAYNKTGNASSGENVVVQPKDGTGTNASIRLEKSNVTTRTSNTSFSTNSFYFYSFTYICSTSTSSKNARASLLIYSNDIPKTLLFTHTITGTNIAGPNNWMTNGIVNIKEILGVSGRWSEFNLVPFTNYWSAFAFRVSTNVNAEVTPFQFVGGQLR